MKVFSTLVGGNSKDYLEGDWVVVSFEALWYPGKVRNVDSDEIEIKCMEQINQQLHHFIWPQKDDVCWYNINEVICKVNHPFPISNTALILSSKDIENISEVF